MVKQNHSKLQKLHQIPESVFGLENIFICKEDLLDVDIDDRGVTFEKLNLLLKKDGIITQREFRKLDYVRVERNKLHLQSLNTRDTGYTKRKFNKIAEPLDFLTRKLLS